MDYIKEINEIWSMVQDRMKQQISITAMNLWFGDIEITSFSGNTLTLTASSEFKQQIITEKYLSQLEELFEEFMGFNIKISILSKNSSVGIEKIKEQINEEPQTSDFDGILPQGVTAHSRTDGDTLYVFLQNFSNRITRLL